MLNVSRKDTYTWLSFFENELNLSISYKKNDYDALERIYNNDTDCTIRLGAGFAKAIVLISAGVELCQQFYVIVKDEHGSPQEDLTKFLNNYFKRQLGRIIEGIITKNKLGECYLTVDLDRNIEVIHPKFTYPNFSLYSARNLHSAKTIDFRVQHNENNRTIKYRIERVFTTDKVSYTVYKGAREKSREKSIDFPNPLEGKPFIIKFNNLVDTGSVFGVSEFFSSIPLMEAFHKLMLGGSENQQIIGKAIFGVEHVQGSTKKFIKDTFGINVDDIENKDTSLAEFLKTFKLLVLPGEAQGKYYHPPDVSKGTIEILKTIKGIISIYTMIPEFLFGGSVEQSNATVREQYGPLLLKSNEKRAYLEEVLTQLSRMVLAIHSIAYDYPGIGKDKIKKELNSLNTEKINNLDFTIIFPPVLTSENRLKKEVIQFLAEMNYVSPEGVLANYTELFPDTEGELRRAEETRKQYGLSIGKASKVEPTEVDKGRMMRRYDDEPDDSGTGGPADKSGGVD